MGAKKIIKWIAIALGAGLVIALFVYNAQPQKQESVAVTPWNENMVLGHPEAPNTLIDYADYFCAYCTDLHKQTSSEQFKREYLDTGKVKVESRIVTLLSEKSPNTEQGAEAAFCAADQKKFEEYSDDIIPRIKTDYFDKGIGTTKGVAYRPIDKLPLSYFEQSAQTVGINVEQFSGCMTSHTFASKAAANTNRALQAGVTGLPYVVINSFKTSGFDGTYASLKMILKAGGVE